MHSFALEIVIEAPVDDGTLIVMIFKYFLMSTLQLLESLVLIFLGLTEALNHVSLAH
jgi:hypothetical protein